MTTWDGLARTNQQLQRKLREAEAEIARLKRESINCRCTDMVAAVVDGSLKRIPARLRMVS